MKTKKPKNPSRASVKPPTSLFPGLLRAAVISLGCGLLLLLILCAVLLSTDDPGAYAQTAGMLIPLPISVLCGVLAAKQTSVGGIPAGLLGGALLCLLLFALGIALPVTAVPDMDAAAPARLSEPIRAGACLLLSAIGGYCTTHKKPKTHRRHR